MHIFTTLESRSTPRQHPEPKAARRANLCISGASDVGELLMEASHGHVAQNRSAAAAALPPDRDGERAALSGAASSVRHAGAPVCCLGLGAGALRSPRLFRDCAASQSCTSCATGLLRALTPSLLPAVALNCCSLSRTAWGAPPLSPARMPLTLCFLAFARASATRGFRHSLAEPPSRRCLLLKRTPRAFRRLRWTLASSRAASAPSVRATPSPGLCLHRR